MTDLERRALLGDREAQEECTRQGIVLPCPFCGGEAFVVHNGWVECEKCVAETTYYGSKEAAIMSWNTRAAPPVGRCETCEHNLPRVDDFGNPYILCGWHGFDMEEDGFCSDYKPKEADHGQE